MPGKKTVSVKKFLADFRSGASDVDLMARHGLDQRGLHKMLSVLEERQLVPAEELKRNRYEPPDEQQEQERFDPPMPSGERASSGSGSGGEGETDTHSACPQCGARVTEQMLTCPECGHVLPGENRWSRVQPERSSRFRIPPWVIGCIIAFPIALGMYAVFKHILVPMSAASIHKRTHPSGKPVPQGHETVSKPGSANPTHSSLDEEIQRLTSEGILLRASGDYGVFRVSERWYALSRDAKVAFVTRLGSALDASGVATSFEIRDETGIVGARVNKEAIELLDRYGFSETIARQGTDARQTPAAGTGAPGSPQPTPQAAPATPGAAR